MAVDMPAERRTPLFERHQNDLVHWSPWDAAVIERARRADRPLLVVLTFTGCGLSGRFQSECFDEPEIAQLMNERFECVLVDRHERPDVEACFLPAALAANPDCALPLTLFLTPELTLIFAAPYLPASASEGRGFRELLERVVDVWDRDRDELHRRGAELLEHARRAHQALPVGDVLTQQALEARHALQAALSLDTPGAEFPMPAVLSFLLSEQLENPDPLLGSALRGRLDRLASDGLRDPISGGFARCAADLACTVPFPERGLSDNAQLALVYLEAAEVLGDERYAEVARGALDFIVRELTTEQGAFATTLGVDGRSERPLVHLEVDVGELKERLSPATLEVALRAFRLTEAVSGEPALARVGEPPSVIAALSDADEAQVQLAIEEARQVIAAQRQGTHVVRDSLVVAGYNGLAIRALAVAALHPAFSSQRDVYLSAAQTAAKAVLLEQWSNGGLSRVAAPRALGSRAMLQDFALLAEGLLALFAATQDVQYRDRAMALAVQMRERFVDSTGRALALEPDAAPELPFRPTASHDGALPPAYATCAAVFTQVGQQCADDADASEWYELARAVLRAESQRMTRGARAHAAGLLAARTLARQLVSRDDAARDQDTLLAALPIAGGATESASRGYFRRLGLPQGACHRLPKSKLWVSRIGLGSYRLSLSQLESRLAASLALSEGANFLDTAPSYGNGEAERALGGAIGSKVTSGALRREELVVMTKVGLSNQPPGGALAGWTTLSGSTGYSLSPAWLDEQIASSARRLGLQRVDIVLVHSPELLLPHRTREALVAELAGALAHLESLRLEGRIASYGVSLGRLLGDEALRPTELCAAVARAGAKGFELVQLPLNPLELGAAEVQPGQGASWLETAHQNDWSIVAHRPLNALAGDTLIRFADAPEVDASDYEGVHRTLRELEEEFRMRLGAVLAAVPDIELPVSEFFTWADRVGEYELSSRELWDDFERHILSAHLPGLLHALNRAFAGKQLDGLWQNWRQRYVVALEAWVLAARRRSGEATNARNAPFHRVLAERAPADLRGASLSRLVLWNLSSADGIASVLTGLTTCSHVQDALGTLRWREADEPLDDLRDAVAAMPTLTSGTP